VLTVAARDRQEETSRAHVDGRRELARDAQSRAERTSLAYV
jgi:hypothetical protein